MSNYSNTKATIAANVYTNHNNEVTAEMVKAGINAVVDTLIAGGFIYKGVATTSTNPGSPDANVFYIATAPGTYTNFGSLVVADGEVAILKYNGSWSKEVTGAATAAEVTALGQEVNELESVLKIVDGESGEVITILDDNDGKIAEITTDGIKNYVSEIVDGNDSVLVSNDEDGISANDGDFEAQGKRILFTDDSDNYVGEIKNDGFHAKAFFIQDEDEADAHIIEDSRVQLSLPDTIYAVVGDTLQIFFRGIMQAVDPYRYDILVNCSKGSKYPRYFEYTPTPADIGTTIFKVTIKNNNGETLSEKSCNLVTIAEPTSPASLKTILCFGDSLTSAGFWPEEACRRLIGSGGTPSGKGLNNIAFKGKLHNNLADFFGVGGWTWASYTTAGTPAFRFQVSGVTSLSLDAVYSNNGHSYTIKEINVTGGVGNILCTTPLSTNTPTESGTLTKVSGNGDATIAFSSAPADTRNPLWDTEENKMTFIPYANDYCGGQIDAVYTLLSWNGLSARMTDFSAIMANVKTFADTLHSEFPSAKLKIMGLQVPSINGGMGANYGASGPYADAFGMTITALNMNKAYQDFANSDGYNSFVEFVNVASQFDSENNMPQAEHAVNTRNTDTEMRGTNGVHPATSGYYQIADVVYRSIVKEFCQ